MMSSSRTANTFPESSLFLPFSRGRKRTEDSENKVGQSLSFHSAVGSSLQNRQRGEAQRAR